ncbi:MAG TPA: hypothetical protein VEP89_01380 [Draconibacterium sp.]|nr:hypothetical protein [Draconibacterium sp.]
MQNKIKTYPVQHPLLRKYLYFFWALRIEDIQLNHKLIPQRNINMRFNLSDTAHYICRNNEESLLFNVRTYWTNFSINLRGDLYNYD